MTYRNEESTSPSIRVLAFCIFDTLFATEDDVSSLHFIHIPISNFLFHFPVPFIFFPDTMFQLQNLVSIKEIKQGIIHLCIYISVTNLKNNCEIMINMQEQAKNSNQNATFL